jgi:ribosomal subunit interface protein
MQLTVTGKGVEVGNALRQHIDASLDGILGKYFRTAIEAHVVFSREAHSAHSDLTIHIGRGIIVNSAASASDFYAAFDTAADRLAKRLRRHKRRLRDYHAKSRNASGGEPEWAQSFVLAAPQDVDGDTADDDSEDVVYGTDIPVIIAEMSTEVPNLTVSEAVMQMDLVDAPVLLFRNRSHGSLNVVYRRGDGNIGWIDPTLRGVPR